VAAGCSAILVGAAAWEQLPSRSAITSRIMMDNLVFMVVLHFFLFLEFVIYPNLRARQVERLDNGLTEA
jgi:hypothetical protein